MSGVLDGKTALLTGASAGIGLATARAMLNAGTSGVVINGRNAERADAAAQSLKADFPDRTIAAAPADIATPDGATKAVETALAALGHIDILVNSAGGNDMPALFHKLDIATIPGMVGPACNAIVLPCRAVLDHMSARGSGSIINVASDAAKIATPGESVIGGVMAFIAMFTRGLAIEAKRNALDALVALRHGPVGNGRFPLCVGNAESADASPKEPVTDPGHVYRDARRAHGIADFPVGRSYCLQELRFSSVRSGAANKVDRVVSPKALVDGRYCRGFLRVALCCTSRASHTHE